MPCVQHDHVSAPVQPSLEVFTYLTLSELSLPAGLPPCSSSPEVRYIWAADKPEDRWPLGAPVATHYDVDFVRAQCRGAMAFLAGHFSPVTTTHAWKCGYCMFRGKCPAAAPVEA